MRANWDKQGFAPLTYAPPAGVPIITTPSTDESVEPSTEPGGTSVDPAAELFFSAPATFNSLRDLLLWLCWEPCTAAIEDLLVSHAYFLPGPEFVRALVACFEPPPLPEESKTWRPRRIELWRKGDVVPLQRLVLKILTEWIALHWRPERDAQALPEIRRWVKEQDSEARREESKDVTKHLALLVKVLQRMRPEHRGARVAERRTLPVLDDAPKIVSSPDDKKRLSILDFHNTSGGKQLAQQLTLYVADMWRGMDVEALSELWMRAGDNKEKADKLMGKAPWLREAAVKYRAMSLYHNALSIVVGQTILEARVKDRPSIARVWLDVARVRECSIPVTKACRLSAPFRLRSGTPTTSRLTLYTGDGHAPRCLISTTSEI